MTNTESRLVRSFGRIKSRKLSDNKQDLFDNSFPKIKFTLKDSFSKKDFSSKKIRILEIGFGFGDFTAYKAQNNSDAVIFAAEPHINGIVNLLSLIERDGLDNIRISNDDARLLLECFEDGFFDEIYILFPDPWPKLKHFKRRIVTAEFLSGILSQKLTKNGKILIATDHDSYKIWINRELLKVSNLKWQCQQRTDWLTKPQQWIKTKYQKKAEREGRQSVFYNIVKI